MVFYSCLVDSAAEFSGTDVTSLHTYCCLSNHITLHEAKNLVLPQFVKHSTCQRMLHTKYLDLSNIYIL